MPNWCHNIALFHHNDPVMMERLKHASYSNELLNEFIPMPENEEIQDEWCAYKWGTKWDAVVLNIILKADGYYEIFFKTAWSPPIPFYKFMINLGFSVKAVYKETGIYFIGQFVEGVHDHFSLDYDKDTYKSLPKFILDYYQKEIEEEKELLFCPDDLN